MDPKSLRDLQLDVRLQHRANWISDQELAQALDGLPDVSDQIQPPDDAEGQDAGAADDTPTPQGAGEAPFPGRPVEGG